MNAVVQHFIFFLTTLGYSATSAARSLSTLLVASLGGRTVVSYIADRFIKEHHGTLSFLLGAVIPLLFLARHPVAAAIFAILFGFFVGAAIRSFR